MCNSCININHCRLLTCTADKHWASKSDSCPLAGMNAHWQGFNQGSLLVSHIIRKPAHTHTHIHDYYAKTLKCYGFSHYTMCPVIAIWLVAEVCTVFVVSAQVSIIWRSGTEEYAGRQIVASRFEVLIYFTRNSRLNGNSVPCWIQRWKINSLNLSVIDIKWNTRHNTERTNLLWGASQQSPLSPHDQRLHVPIPWAVSIHSPQCGRSSSSVRLIHRCPQNASEVTPLQ